MVSTIILIDSRCSPEFGKHNDQRAFQHFQQEEFDQVPESASDHWKGAASYRLQNFEQAEEIYNNRPQQDAITHYNRGNTLAHLNRLEEALAAYDEALSLSSEMSELYEDIRNEIKAKYAKPSRGKTTHCCDFLQGCFSSKFKDNTRVLILI